MNQWFATPYTEVLNILESTPEGLSHNEAKKRLNQYGLNEIKTLDKVKWYVLLIAQFWNIMVGVLILALVVSLVVHEYIDAVAIGVVIILNAIIGFIQEYRAEQAVEALKEMTAPHALVMREGQTEQIESTQLVPGDIIILEEGSHIPADARIIKSVQMRAIESTLTGESTAVEKKNNVIKKFDSLGDLKNMVFMGTTIARGHGLAVVTGTGMQTEFGKIAHMVQTEDSGPTPLQVQLDQLSKAIAILVGVITVALVSISYLFGSDPIEMLLLSISLAVSVIPEGLPAVTTLTLAISVQKMAKKNAIIRKLPAAETLGSTSVICSDKTGTLTQNQMTVEIVNVNGTEYQITGSGYKPTGEIQLNGKKTKLNKELDRLIKIGTHCNNSLLFKSKAKWKISGDPTEACLLTLSNKAGIDHESFLSENPRLDELIFDSERKRMSTRDSKLMYTKGAMDGILKICTHIQVNGRVKKFSAKDKEKWMEMNDMYASEAYRVLAFAYKEVKDKKDFKEENMVFVGLTCMMDPPRKQVKAAIEKCRSAHIKVVMITGDHALTAMAIGKKIGLYKEGEKVLTGAELEKMSQKDLYEQVEEIKIYARVNPQHKVRILKAFQEHGHIVAMTGDGVNDAPALKSADIGVAMGITGTDVTKEAGEMILTDDNFATIVNSVESGRTIYRNLKKFIRFLLSANFNAVIVICVVFLAGMPIPFIPLQILWVNLITDSLPAIALGSDVPDEGIMDLKPRKPKTSIWHELMKFSFVAGALASMISLIMYFQKVNVLDLEHMRTIMFTTMVVFELLLVFSVRFDHKHYFTHFTTNKFLIFSVISGLALQMLAIYSPLLQPILETVPLSLEDWVWIISLCIFAISILEVWKFFRPAPSHV